MMNQAPESSTAVRRNSYLRNLTSFNSKYHQSASKFTDSWNFGTLGYFWILVAHFPIPGSAVVPTLRLLLFFLLGF